MSTMNPDDTFSTTSRSADGRGPGTWPQTWPARVIVPLLMPLAVACGARSDAPLAGEFVPGVAGSVSSTRGPDRDSDGATEAPSATGAAGNGQTGVAQSVQGGSDHECTPSWHACPAVGECCSGMCVSHTCFECVTVGGKCEWYAECCSGRCDPSGVCSCGTGWMPNPCATDADCCEGWCSATGYCTWDPEEP